MAAQIGDYKRAVIETSLAQEASKLKLIYLLLIIILLWSEPQHWKEVLYKGPYTTVRIIVLRTYYICCKLLR